MVFGRLTQNWRYKLVALVVSVLLWVHVQNLRNPVTSIPQMKAPVHCVNLHKGYVASFIPEEITVTLVGPKLDLNDINPKRDITASVDLTDLEVGTHRVPVKVSLPRNWEKNITVQPQLHEVAVTIESISSRTLPVEVKEKNAPPIGWTLNNPELSPAKITVSGRSSIVNNVARLVVTADATPLKPSVDDYLQVSALDSQGNEVNNVRLSPESVRVVLKLVEAPVKKDVFVSPSVAGQPQYPYHVTKISVTPVSVTVKGRPESLVGTSTIVTDDVDVTGASSNVVRRASLRVPPGLEIEGSSTVKVTVRIEQIVPSR